MSTLLAALTVVLASIACRLPVKSNARSTLEPSIATASTFSQATLPPTASATAAATPIPATATALPAPVFSTVTTSTRQTTGAVSVVTIANTTHYTLAGQTATEIDDYMRTFGPTDSLGNRWFALTDPLFDWDYDCTCADGSCVTGPVTVFVTLDYTLPTWELLPESDPTLVGQWRFFEEAIAVHERGHGELASICGQLLGEAFVSVPPQDSCSAIDNAVLTASQPVFSECRAMQGRYETQTNHGQNDGVLWPP